MKFIICLILVITFTSCKTNEHPLQKIYTDRGYTEVDLPKPGSELPEGFFDNVKSEKVIDISYFPEGPSYRPSDNSRFFSGSHDLARISEDGERITVFKNSGGGGTHFLPDGSVLVVGVAGLRRFYPDGSIELIVDGKKVGSCNDITMGIHKEIYFSVPRSKAIYRVSPGKNGKIEKVLSKPGNGLDVDSTGKYLYVHRGNIFRYEINGPDKPLGKEELFYEFRKPGAGLDGCTFDSYGNFYSVHFANGMVTVVSPKGKLIGNFFSGVKPATNATFWGPALDQLMITAGAPSKKNTQILNVDLGITGFCGHKGDIHYPKGIMLKERFNPEDFIPKK
ncbi:MAG: SMP-30/gluconolactonase/LRE family protein [Lentisphaeraceae bacterium]|nr:SMP-30/gluconolactonase/LRE family protein [Lentisphaeraceae bacterium]